MEEKIFYLENGDTRNSIERKLNEKEEELLGNIKLFQQFKKEVEEIFSKDGFSAKAYEMFYYRFTLNGLTPYEVYEEIKESLAYEENPYND